MDPETGQKQKKLAVAARETGMADSGLSENAVKVLERRYLAKDKKGKVTETPSGMFRRVARNLSLAELGYGASEEIRRQVEDDFHQVMSGLEFLPNSPTLMNAGRELQQLSACFVLPIDDSLDSIFSTVKQTALIHKSGGGTGFSFSRLRPAGDTVGSTGGVASGPVSFIGAFDATTDVVKQGSTRRGANMAILNVDHPDVLEFIRVKRVPGKLVNFNISVGITGEFMEKVKRGEEYDLINPRSGEVTGQLNAKEVLDEIVESAWATGDPGLVFLDRMNEANPNPQLGKIESTNPCVTGDTLIYTSKGMQRAVDLHNEQAPLAVATDGRFGRWTFQKASNVFSSGMKPVYRLTTHEGYEVRVTGDHQIMTKSGWTKAKNIQPGQAICILNRVGGFGSHGSEEMGELLGSLVGDETPKCRTAVLSFFEREKEPAPDLEDIKHNVPEKVLTGTREMQTGFLRGIFSAHGHVNQPIDGEAVIHLTSISRQMLLGLQRLLLNLGITSRIYCDHQDAEAKELPNGQEGSQTCQTKACHEMLISKYNLPQFQARIGFLDGFKQGLLDTILESHHPRPPLEHFTARFKELVPDGLEEVFDLTEPVTHSFIANGVVVSNCGEQILAPYESCNLGSVNLARMLGINNEETLEIDWERLRRVIYTGVRMLDNVIDMNQFPIKEIEEMSRKTRRIGLGIMGWADALIQMGIQYDSEEALELAHQVMGFIQEETHRASGILAEERGNFPAWEGSIYEEPMRNSAPVTIAPTGTISIIAGASSGIEPLFALSYVRTIMDGTRMVEINPHFEALAIGEGFHTPELMERIAETGSLKDLVDPESSTGQTPPQWVGEIFRTSHDISPDWHVLMQSAFQAHTDNSVSKTINMPADATREDVKNAYILAYMTNCNGITVYRDGSKAEQVLSAGAAGQEAATADTGVRGPQERPRVMTGVTERFRTGHGNMYVTLNFDRPNHPFEIFTNLGKAGGCDSAQLEAVSRMASLCLRSGVDPVEIIQNLQGITCCPHYDNGVLIRSTPDAMAHMLRRHGSNDSDATEAQTETQKETQTESKQKHWSQRSLIEASRLKCPDCNTLVEYREGCETCPDPSCGWSKCY